MATKKVSPQSESTSAKETSPPSESTSPAVKNPTSLSPYILPTLAVLFLLANIGLFAYLQVKSAKTNEPTPTPEPAPAVSVTPTPTKAPKKIPSGTQEFTSSFGKDFTMPKTVKTVVSPLDPKVGGTQKVTVTIVHTSPITSASVNVITDHKTNTYPLTKISGSDTDGVWQGSWTMSDTYLYTYYLQFDIKSTTTSYLGGLKIR